mmetsp:Transcript_26575/g.44496  ORF Transcript_26575/g.44496 Transcript_26575/m.44496 type:complete len:241 (+) Transcript_26575:51-773(+)
MRSAERDTLPDGIAHVPHADISTEFCTLAAESSSCPTDQVSAHQDERSCDQASPTARSRRIRDKVVELAKRRWREDVTGRGLFAPYSPTPKELIQKTLQVLELDNRSVLLDIGCGDGRWLIEACSQFRCKGIGVESNAELVDTVRRHAAEQNLADLVTLHNTDVKLMGDLSLVTVAVFYGSRASCKELAPFLTQRLQPNTYVVSVQFEFPWALEQKVTGAGFVASIYRSPAHETTQQPHC